jgi:hypothetical protein
MPPFAPALQSRRASLTVIRAFWPANATIHLSVSDGAGEWAYARGISSRQGQFRPCLRVWLDRGHFHRGLLRRF